MQDSIINDTNMTGGHLGGDGMSVAALVDEEDVQDAEDAEDTEDAEELDPIMPEHLRLRRRILPDSTLTKTISLH